MTELNRAESTHLSQFRLMAQHNTLSEIPLSGLGWRIFLTTKPITAVRQQHWYISLEKTMARLICSPYTI